MNSTGTAGLGELRIVDADLARTHSSASTLPVAIAILGMSPSLWLRGRRLFGLVARLIGLAGYAACCIGVFAAIPLIMVAWATIYTRISGTAASFGDAPPPPPGGYGYYAPQGGYSGPPGYGPPQGGYGGYGGPPQGGYGGPPPGGFGGFGGPPR